ncbi:MAG: hypothetical protein KA002_01825 [Firmicutes bacterium]|nr:hypothetical protein [Bacillota bacterium]
MQRYGVGGRVIDQMGGDREWPDSHGLAHTYCAAVLDGDKLRQEYRKRVMQRPCARIVPATGAVNGRQHSTQQQFVDGVAVARRIIVSERQRQPNVQQNARGA